jgi:hypothetical protein
MSLPTWIRSWFGNRARRFTIRDDPELAAQFWVVFRATLARVEADGPVLSDGAHNRIRDLLSPDRLPSWDDAYEIEQLFALLYSEKALLSEFSTRLEDARSVLGRDRANYYRRQRESTASSGELRQLLGTLIGDIQWSYRLDEARRWWARRATNLFITVTVLFGAMLVYVIVDYGTDAATQPSVAAPLTIALTATAGAWGATLSMISSLRTRLQGLQLRDLRMISAQTILLSRALIGVGAGLVLYLFLTSGLLEGSLFPVLEGTGGALALRDFALLVIWAVVAGFSETLVPDLLTSTESRVSVGLRRDADETAASIVRPTEGS